MDREYTRREFYELVWSQPLRTLAQNFGISDVALAKHCKKAHIPVPPRGYWARKQAGKPVIQIALQPRFPGASDRVGGSEVGHYYYGCDWAEKFQQMPTPAEPVFDEEMSSLEERVRNMVGNVKCPRRFEPAHPLVAKLLSHDEERQRDYLKYHSSYYAPLYDAGIERRRLLIINALFYAAGRLGCRASMSTSKYGQNTGSNRPLSISVGRWHTSFTVEPVKSSKDGRRERLMLALGTVHNGAPSRLWEDGDAGTVEDQLSDVLFTILIKAEKDYRNSLIAHREWVIERKAEAEKEIIRCKEEAERKDRELRERRARERIARLLSQASALNRAERIRAYVETALGKKEQIAATNAAIERWGIWARAEADRIDPLKNGTITRAIENLALSEEDEF